MNQNDQKAKVRERYQQQSTLERVLIPARPRTGPFESTTTQRVCAYCRVSTDSVEQLSSFELQRTYYEELTERNPNWELRMIYADEDTSYGQKPKIPWKANFLAVHGLCSNTAVTDSF